MGTLVVVAGAMVAVVAASAASPAQWLPPRDLSGKGADAVIPDIAIDPKGNVVVVWAQSKKSSWTVQAAERPAGGSWGVPRPLSALANHVASPQVAVAGDSVVAVWERYDGKNLLVQTAERDPKTHAWSTPAILSASGRDAQTPRVAVNARGDAVAVWASVSLPRGWSILAASRPAGGAWQATVPLQSPRVGTAVPDVVLDDTGRAVAVWTATAGSGYRVWASARGADGAWSKSVAISGPDATGSITPQIALEGNDDVTAVWSRSVGTNSVIESATRSAKTGTWSDAVQLFPSEINAFAPNIAVDERGDGVLAWASSDQSGPSLKASYRRPGKGWGAPVPLVSGAAGPLTSEVALDGRGDALVVWTRRVGGYSRVQSSRLAGAGTTWSAPRSLSRAGGDAVTPQVALDRGGDGVVVWARYDGKSFVIQGEGFDGNGPDLIKLSMPGTGVVGKRLTFAVTPKDTWTTVRTIRWTFGDGAAGSGRATGHVYTRPGKYLARVSATDAFGHVSSVRRFVQISAS